LYGITFVLCTTMNASQQY